jgi:hypothetical protein
MSARRNPETPGGRTGDRIPGPIGEPMGGRVERELGEATSQQGRRLPERREEDSQAPAGGELRPLARAFVALAQALMEDDREEDEE